jgi:hypothetical protein
LGTFLQSKEGSGHLEHGGHGGIILLLPFALLPFALLPFALLPLTAAAELDKLGHVGQLGVTICVFNMYKSSSPGGTFLFEVLDEVLDDVLDEVLDELLFAQLSFELLLSIL